MNLLTSSQYIRRRITDRQLGEGAFGVVSLPRIVIFPKSLLSKRSNVLNVIKTPLAKFGEAHKGNFRYVLHAKTTTWTIMSTAQFYKTLKKFRHPNIITLYGYNLNVSGAEQFLVYEYAANCSLDSFLQDDGYVRISFGWLPYRLTRKIGEIPRFGSRMQRSKSTRWFSFVKQAANRLRLRCREDGLPRLHLG